MTPAPRKRKVKRPRDLQNGDGMVYVALYGEQKALVEGGCRGGFGAGELAAFLYARSFPREEWRARAAEAFEGMVMS